MYRQRGLGRLLEEFAPDPDGVRDPLPRPAARALAALVEPGWQERAGCVGADPDAWFPESAAHRAQPGVARVCAGCPVRLSCLAAAIVDDEHGIWGGTRRGQRLHARARLLGGDPVRAVLAELLAMPMPATDYAVPHPAGQVMGLPGVDETAAIGVVAWRESA